MSLKFRTDKTLKIMRDYGESKRRQIFADNYRRIRDHNKEADKGVHTYRLGVNQFTDMTQLMDSVDGHQLGPWKLVKLFHVFDDILGYNVLFATNYDFVYGLGANHWGCLGLGHNQPFDTP
ncbi:unnamed protein product, partial [Medioppia subpectinata]